MYYPRKNLVYQDEPAHGVLLKYLFMFIPGCLFIGSLYLWSQGEHEGSLSLLAAVFLIGIIFWAVLPRKYQIYEDHIRIVLGGPFNIKVRFNDIKLVEVTDRNYPSTNFVTSITKTYVRIQKKSGMNFAITPRSNRVFVEHALQAISQWEKTRGIHPELKSISAMKTFKK